MGNSPAESTIMPTSAAEFDYRSPKPPTKLQLGKRLAIGSLCVSLGLFAAGIGLASIYYRLTHVTVHEGLVNGRTVRIQAPDDGTLRDFYVRPGVTVQAGQVLARLDPLPSNQTGGQTQLLQLQQVIQSSTANLTTARQTLALLRQQLQDVENQDQQLQTANVAIASEDVERYQAIVAAVTAREASARAEYQRYASLLEEGAVSAQQVEQLEADWQAAKAAVGEAEANLNSARITLRATNQSVPVKSSIDDLQEQRRLLMQDIQAQENQIRELETGLSALQDQFTQVQRLYAPNNESLDLQAPFTGVVFATEHDAMEQVSQSATLLSLLDCNDLWLETIVSAQQANRIDADKPVRVRLTGSEETINGQVELVAAMSAGELTKARTEALLPTVPSNLVGQPLARVRVQIPPIPQQTQGHQFCGVGQSAQLTFSTKLLGQ